jgi:hypothetical protein
VIRPHHVTETKNVKDFPNSPSYTARSLLEWTKESGICIASRVYEDSQVMRDRGGCTITIEKHAKAAELWPDEIFGDDQTLRDIKFFATDGAYKVSTTGARDIITSTDVLRNNGAGSGALICVPQRNGDPVLGFRVTSSAPEQGLNAYVWELVMQVIGLHFMKHMPTEVKGTTDCTSAMERVNQSLCSYQDKLSHTTAGILSLAAFQFAESCDPRVYSWTKHHPEDDANRRANPSEFDKAIFMADAVAGNSPKTLGSLHLPVQQEDLDLRNILNEIIPMFKWHFRSAADPNAIIWDDPEMHQHHAQLKKMTASRDRFNNVQRWTKTALEFTASIHKPKNQSYWAAARRALIVFDWMGHGRNRAKLESHSPNQQAHEAKCRQCRLMDSQEHLMLECTHGPLNAIRCAARTKQSSLAAKLLKEHEKSPNLKHFIKSLTSKCWNKTTPDLSRYWLGTWSQDTLESLLLQSQNAPLAMTTRDKYIEIATTLTKPLIDAYYLMLTATIKAKPGRSTEEDPLPLLDHFPTDTHSNGGTLHSSHPLILSMALPSVLRLEIEAMHIQKDHDPNSGPSLNCSDSLFPFTDFTLSDAALLRESADGIT